MLNMKLLIPSFTIFLAFQFHIYFIHGFYPDNDYSVFSYSGSVPYTCSHHSACGDINITYPFRLKGYPENCGLPNYELSCINNETIVRFNTANYVVKSIDYGNYTIRVYASGVKEGNCFSILQYYKNPNFYEGIIRPYEITNSYAFKYESIAYISCEKPFYSPLYLNISDCINEKEALGRSYSYVLVDESLDLSNLATSCAIDLVATTTSLRDTRKNLTYVDIYKHLVYGLELSFINIRCYACIGKGRVSEFCRLYNNIVYFNCYDYPFLSTSELLPYPCNHRSSCGEIINITYPFRLKGDPQGCGEPKYELSCINNQTILNLKEGDFAVKAINYTEFTIRVSDLGVQKGNYSSVPRYSISRDSYGDTNIGPYAPYEFRQRYRAANSKYFERIAYVSCERPVNSPFYLELNPSDCISAFERGRRYCYILVDQLYLLELNVSCVVDLVTTATLLRDAKKNLTYVDIHKDLVHGFELSFYSVQCQVCIGKDDPPPFYCHCTFDDKFIYVTQHFDRNEHCNFYNIATYIQYHVHIGLFLLGLAPEFSPSYGCGWRDPTEYFMLIALNLLAFIFGQRFLCGCPCFFAFLIYKRRKRHLSMDDSLEQFLQKQNDLMPIRYSYSQIKKMCKGFQEKLGEGGFGSVFKGKLKSKQFVAIKMLNNPKANAQDFINEVATIGRIHHVNVIRLVGFCAEGQKRALVYDFMHKGSLDKYICSQPGYISLGWEKMYEISLGIARGIEYLHGGCDMQILHFDIKPHNVLLDENYIPKISDFGLAKSYPTGNSIVNVTAARGTIGYIAPELIYKQIGGVSSKADIYSFGMLLMEMTGKKKKQNEIPASTSDSSKMYFPMWVYHEIVDRGGDTEIDEVEKIARKMIVVALWCIQIRPCDRPLMRKVIKMLEGKVENLELPPKPTFNIEEMPVENVEESINPAWSSFTSMAITSESAALMIAAE